jgi:nucleoside-diphosphate-sugar epimerase
MSTTPSTQSEDSLHVVLGAGPLGRATAVALLADRRRVRMVNRSGRLEEPPAGAEIVAADLYRADAVRDVAQGAVSLYMAAQPGYTEWAEKFPPLIDSILTGLEGSGTRLIMGDNLYMYGAVAGPLHEALPNAATTRKGRVRAAMSDALLEAHRSGRVPVAIARGSDFYGPWVLGSSVGERVFRPALAGKAAQFTGDLDAPHTVTYIGDFGRTLALLGSRDEALGAIWHVPNDRPQITPREFAALIFAELGVPPRVSTMGRTMMRLGGLFIPEARESVEMMYQFERPFVVESSKISSAFAMAPTPMEEAVRETLAWYRSHPAPKNR